MTVKLDRRSAIGGTIAAAISGLLPSPPEELMGRIEDVKIFTGHSPPLKLHRFWLEALVAADSPPLEIKPVDYLIGGARWTFGFGTSFKTYKVIGYVILDREGTVIHTTHKTPFEFMPLDGESLTIELPADTIHTMKWVDRLLDPLEL